MTFSYRNDGSFSHFKADDSYKVLIGAIPPQAKIYGMTAFFSSSLETCHKPCIEWYPDEIKKETIVLINGARVPFDGRSPRLNPLTFNIGTDITLLTLIIEYA